MAKLEHFQPVRRSGLEQAWRIIADAAVPSIAKLSRSAILRAGCWPSRSCARFESPRAAVSTMDGYAVRDGDARVGAELEVIGTSAAGASFNGPVGAGQAVRIFTGAALPDGADRVMIQENVTIEGDRVTLVEATGAMRIRPGAGQRLCGWVTRLWRQGPG